MSSEVASQDALTELKTRAFIRVTKAAEWLVKKAGEVRKDKYIDEYVSMLGAPEERLCGVMTYAEGILTFLEVMEWNDSNPKTRLPCVTEEQLIGDIQNLLDLYQARGFDGAPYVFESGTEDAKLEFTDAVCFLGAALHQTLLRLRKWRGTSEKKKLGSPEIEQTAQDVYKQCVKWLLENKISHPEFKNKSGWGWTGVSGVKKYTKLYVPPQTYFTCSALITLLEAATFHQDIMQPELLHILQAVDDARVFLIDTQIKNGDRVGWVDFIPITDAKGDYPHKSPEQPINDVTGRPDYPISTYHSLCVLEAFGYLYLYADVIKDHISGKANEFAGKILDAVKNDYQNSLIPSADVLLDQFGDLSDWRQMTRRPARHLLPKTVNQRQENLYIDGATLANIWNAFEVFSLRVPESHTAEKWKSLRTTVLKQLLDSSGQEGGFPSLLGLRWLEEGKSYQALYATRASISVLRNFGLQAPPEKVEIALEEVEHKLDVARLALDDVRDRLRIIAGTDPSTLKKSDFMQGFRLAQKLEEYKDTVMHLFEHKRYNLFILPEGISTRDVTYVMTEDKCAGAVKRYRDLIAHAAEKEKVELFVKVLELGGTDWDRSFCPELAILKLEDLKKAATERPEQIMDNTQRFLLLQKFLETLNRELSKQLPQEIRK